MRMRWWVWQAWALHSWNSQSNRGHSVSHATNVLSYHTSKETCVWCHYRVLWAVDLGGNITEDKKAQRVQGSYDGREHRNKKQQKQNRKKPKWQEVKAWQCVTPDTARRGMGDQPRRTLETLIRTCLYLKRNGEPWSVSSEATGDTMRWTFWISLASRWRPRWDGLASQEAVLQRPGWRWSQLGSQGVDGRD